MNPLIMMSWIANLHYTVAYFLKDYNIEDKWAELQNLRHVGVGAHLKALGIVMWLPGLDFIAKHIRENEREQWTINLKSHQYLWQKLANELSRASTV